MANTKEIHIEATVPYNWAAQLTPEEAGCFASFFLSPTGFRLRYFTNGGSMIPLPNGGQLTMYKLTIWGTEAVWHKTLTLIVQTLARQEHATIHYAKVRDLDAPTGWQPIAFI